MSVSVSASSSIIQHQSYEALELPRLNVGNLHSDFFIPTVSLFIDGNQDTGQITLLSQLHTIYKETDPELVNLGVIQLAIARQILDKSLKTVFLEGLHGPSPDSTLSTCTNENASYFGKYIHGLLPDWRKSRITPEQLVETVQAHSSSWLHTNVVSSELLFLAGALGGAFLAAVVDPTVTLHPTVLSHTDHQLRTQQEQLTYNCAEERYIRFTLREHIAMGMIARHLAINPGSHVTLVFGCDHTFMDALHGTWSYDRPVFTQINFWGARNLLRPHSSAG